MYGFMLVLLSLNACGGSSEAGLSNSATSAPSNVQAIAGDGKAVISWDEVSSAVSYNIYYSDSSGLTKALATKIEDVTSPYVQDGLNEGDFLYYAVTASNNSGESALSDEVRAILPPPRTGQTTSYDFASDEDEDGELQKGFAWPTLRFRDNSDGTVTDMLTGLMWLKDMDSVVNKNWGDALVACNTLDHPESGHDDWRLPNIREIWSLIDYSQDRPALPSEGSVFDNIPNIAEDIFWTSTTDAQQVTQAWFVDMRFGELSTAIKSTNSNTYVLPVRNDTTVVGLEIPVTGQDLSYASTGGEDGDLQSGVFWPNPRFTDNGDDTVTDILTGLMWLNNVSAIPDGNSGSWFQALDRCEELIFPISGYGDWRLPNVRELMSIIDYGQDADLRLPPLNHFDNIQEDLYWTSTTSADEHDDAWVVDLGTGELDTNYKYDAIYYIWPVRDAQ